MSKYMVVESAHENKWRTRGNAGSRAHMRVCFCDMVGKRAEAAAAPILKQAAL